MAALKDNSLNETASFVEIITRMWDILNVKNIMSGDQLNDDNRNPFRATDDKRFDFLPNLGKSFEKWTHSGSLKILEKLLKQQLMGK